MFTSHAPTPDQPAHLFTAQAGDRIADLDRAQVMEAFRETGVILVRGATFSVDEFRDFARHLCPVSVFNESPGRLELGGEGDVQSVNLGVDYFPLHPELSREPWRPDACFFGCITAPEEAGQTTFCDGVALVDALPAPIREAMAGRSLIYIRTATREMLDFWLGTPDPSPELLANPPAECPYRFRRIGQQVVRYFTRPLLQPTRFGGHLAFGNFLLFAHDKLGRPNYPCLDDGKPVPDAWMTAIRDTSDRLTHEVAWQAGDILILDNSRHMHGRRPITDPDKRMIATYFGYLDGASPLAGEPDDPVWRRESFRPPQRPQAGHISI